MSRYYFSFVGEVLPGVSASTSWTINSVARPKPGFDRLDLPCTLVVQCLNWILYIGHQQSYEELFVWLRTPLDSWRLADDHDIRRDLSRDQYQHDHDNHIAEM